VISALLILAALATLLSGGRFGFANVGSAAILLIIALIFFLNLALKSRTVARLLDLEAVSQNLATNSLPEAKTNALHAPVHKAPASVTERATLKLNSEDSQKSNL
jgi:hypothetical protein